MKPSVSINLCCYNSEKYLQETLQSIVNQTYKDWELVIINDGSSDSTESIVFEFKNQGYPIIYHYQENRGLGASRNKAIELSQGKYIAFIDHDDIWLPQKLEKQIPLFEKNPRVGLVFCDTIFFNEKGKKRQMYKNNKPPCGMVFKELLEKYYLSMETTVIRRSALDSLSEWFDERFNMIEEVDLFIRLAHDWEIDYVPEPLAMWRAHVESLSFSRKEDFPKEKKIMLQKFSLIYDNFQTTYSREIKMFESQIEKEYAILDWEKGNRTKVRERLKPFLLYGTSIKLYYLLSYFPYSFFKKLRALFGRITPA